ncbi:MAG: ribosome maturation factor RimM, partial [Dehalococcoidia bacterium]|nr:ribosome maturation factor RimM [Dehalococcoidia bacterium]
MIGVITKAWGIRGDVAMALETDFPERLVPGRVVYIDGAPRSIRRVRLTNTAAILQFDGVTDRTTAETLVGKIVAVPESSLPPLPTDTYYIHQILGLTVKETSGATLGVIKDVWDLPANDVYVVGTPTGDLLIPA